MVENDSLLARVVDVLVLDLHLEARPFEERPGRRLVLVRHVGDRRRRRRALRDAQRDGRARADPRAGARRLRDDRVGRLVRVDRRLRDIEAGGEQGRAGTRIRLADDVRDRDLLDALGDVDPDARVAEDLASGRRVLRGDGVRGLRRVDVRDEDLQVGRRQRRHGIRLLFADDVRNRHLRPAGRDEDGDEIALVRALSPLRVLAVDDPLRERLVRVHDGVHLEALLLDLRRGLGLAEPNHERDGDRFVRIQLVVDLLVAEPGRDAGHGEQQQHEQPGPDRAGAARRAFVAVVGGRRRPRGRHRRRDARRPRGDDRRRAGDARAGEDRRRRLGGLCRDAQAACDSREVGVHLLGRLVAVFRVLGQRAQRHHVDVLGNLVPELGRRHGHLGQMLHRDLERRVAGERDLAGQHLVQDDPDRVDVGALVDRGSLRLLGRQVLRGADDRADLRHLARARAGDAEVGHLQAAVGVHDDVVRLDVAVDDPVPVCIADRGQDLARVVDRDPDRRRPPADDQLLERPPREILHRDVVRPLGLAAVVDGDDVRVREPRSVLRLAPEALDERVVGGVPVVEDLDRDAPAELLVLGEIDVRHPAGAQLADDPVAPVEDGVDQRVAGDGHDLVTSPPCVGRPPSEPWRSGRRSSRRSRAGSRAPPRPRRAGGRPERRR